MSVIDVCHKDEYPCRNLRARDLMCSNHSSPNKTISALFSVYPPSLQNWPELASEDVESFDGRV